MSLKHLCYPNCVFAILVFAILVFAILVLAILFLVLLVFCQLRLDCMLEWSNLAYNQLQRAPGKLEKLGISRSKH